jgi:hypothetical protein
MRTSKGYLSKACYGRGVSDHHSPFQGDTKAEEGELGCRRLQVCPDWGMLLAWDAVASLM